LSLVRGKSNDEEFIKLENTKIIMQPQYEVVRGSDWTQYAHTMDRGTIEHFSRIGFSPWYGYIIQAEDEIGVQTIQSEIDKILRKHRHNLSKNNRDLDAITSEPPENIIFFAGPFSQETKGMIEQCLTRVQLLKAVQSNYEFFVNPVWVRDVLNLPPPKEISEFLAKRRR